jgi:RNA polymerase sigma-70 factor (ECF subfamily)
MCDSRLVEQALKDYQSGRKIEEIFDVIDNYYRPILVRIFTRQRIPQKTPDDLTQDVIIRVYNSMAEFRGGDSVPLFSGWLFRIARNILRDEIRYWKALKRKDETISLNSGGDDDETRKRLLNNLASSPQLSEKRLITKVNMRLLKEAIDSLPDRMRECVRFRYLQGRKYKQIGELMGGISVRIRTSSGAFPFPAIR